ncbi:hypothetical protein DSM104299_02221 [Baekduia alba]|uniref:COG4280 domain-containing protein n=1 Tax=Baekduia alba TaxID=2997333 RepID=UPI0023403026|nr:hypothetical protein [Baekduia alba]WCB93508.1 hypothetical protein DSM104299_02221 [Baekduia alba]
MSHDVVLFLAVFAACAVEGVEAVTIVLAVGVTRGWRSAWLGTGAALVVLAAVVGALGPALTAVPIDTLRIVVGGLGLAFGLQWLRKAILRAGGVKALHDEDAIYARELAAARAADGGASAFDPYAFTISFKAVVLEGLEVAFIVVTLGSSQGSVPLAAVAAVVAILLVVLAAALAHAPLSRVPENTIKFAVGILLTALGTFWVAEGSGMDWPGGDAAILALVAVYAAFSAVLVRSTRAAVAP